VAISQARPTAAPRISEAERRFSPAKRGGYEPAEVDRFVQRVSDYVGRLEAEVTRQRARAELLERRAVTASEAAYARVFRNLVDVMRSAEDAAAKVRAEANNEADAIVTGARQEAAGVLSAAHREADQVIATAKDDSARAKAERMIRAATVEVDRPSPFVAAMTAEPVGTPPWLSEGTDEPLPPAAAFERPPEALDEEFEAVRRQLLWVRTAPWEMEGDAVTVDLTTPGGPVVDVARPSIEPGSAIRSWDLWKRSRPRERHPANGGGERRSPELPTTGELDLHLAAELDELFRASDADRPPAR
jgi:DivIVA domain-containing protein